MEEHRYILTEQDLKEFSPKLDVCYIAFIVDTYTGAKRVRKVRDKVTEKDYKTPVKGTIYRFSAYAFRGDNKTFLEFKWTDKVQRFEIEFEGEVLPQFKGREEVRGWSILEK